MKIMMHKMKIKRKKMMTWTNKAKLIEPQIILKAILFQNLSFRMINLKMKMKI